MGLERLKNKLERLGLTRSRGWAWRVACKYLVKFSSDDRYLAWVAVDHLARWRRRGYRVVFCCEAEREDLVLKLAERLVKILNELRGEGYA